MSSLSLPSTMPTVYSEGGLSRYLAAIRNFPLLNAAEEAKYAERWREHGDREAAYRLVTSHLRLAAKIALRYRGYGLPVADLISEANVGLMLAVKRFEPKKGFRLATYAMWWIKATVQEYVLRSWSLVKIGTTAAQKKLFFNLRKLKNRIGASDEGELSQEQVAYVAKELKVDGRDVVEMNGRIRGDVSLNVPMTQADTSEEMQDRLVDPLPDPETLVSDAQDRERMGSALKDALAALTSRERSIIEARFLTEQPQTFDELAAEFGVSRERIRQIEARALQKIKGAVCARLDAIPLGPTRLRMPNLGAVEPSLRAGSQA